MAKYLEKTPEEWDEIVVRWHNDESIDIPLSEYMGLNEVEYLRYVYNITGSNLSEHEIREEASRRCREAEVGLMVLEMFGAYSTTKKN